MSEIRATTLDELALEEVVAVPLPELHEGLPSEALVLRDGNGELRAYRNLCKHLPIPMDSGSRDFLDDTGEHLICWTHGALYRREDGKCIHGPCRGRHLDAFPIRLAEDGTIFLETAPNTSLKQG